MVKAPDSRASLDGPRRPGTPLDGSAHWSILVDSEMSPVLVEVRPVCASRSPVFTDGRQVLTRRSARTPGHARGGWPRSVRCRSCVRSPSRSSPLHRASSRTAPGGVPQGGRALETPTWIKGDGADRTQRRSSQRPSYRLRPSQDATCRVHEQSCKRARLRSRPRSRRWRRLRPSPVTRGHPARAWTRRRTEGDRPGSLQREGA